MMHPKVVTYRERQTQSNNLGLNLISSFLSWPFSTCLGLFSAFPQSAPLAPFSFASHGSGLGGTQAFTSVGHLGKLSFLILLSICYIFFKHRLSLHTSLLCYAALMISLSI